MYIYNLVSFFFSPLDPQTFSILEIEFNVVSVAVRHKADIFALITRNRKLYNRALFGDSRENQGY